MACRRFRFLDLRPLGWPLRLVRRRDGYRGHACSPKVCLRPPRRESHVTVFVPFPRLDRWLSFLEQSRFQASVAAARRSCPPIGQFSDAGAGCWTFGLLPLRLAGAWSSDCPVTGSHLTVEIVFGFENSVTSCDCQNSVQLMTVRHCLAVNCLIGNC